MALSSTAPEPPWENQLGITKPILLDPKNGYPADFSDFGFLSDTITRRRPMKGPIWGLLIAFKPREIPPRLEEEKMPLSSLQTLGAWMSKSVKHISKTLSG